MTLPPDDTAREFIEVVGLPADDLDRLSSTELTWDQWTAILRISVGEDAPPMLGSYSVADDAIRFTPQFPLDPGRKYEARFDPARLPRTRAIDATWRAQPLVAIVLRPALSTTPSTVVERVYPSTDVIPENQLRFYIQFSAQMARRSGLEFVHLLDEQGREVKDPFLPLDYELWSGDHTRFTVFVDPGRVKTGLLPQQQMGKSLEAGRNYTLVVDPGWRDAAGLPLKEPFRRSFRVGSADTQPIDPAAWKIETPAAGTRDPLVVVFSESLDHGLLFRSLGVTMSAGTPVHGEVRVEANETRWLFRPRDPWTRGEYRLVALSILEDLAGNQIGRAFEVDQFDEVDASREPQTITRSFRIEAPRE